MTLKPGDVVVFKSDEHRREHIVTSEEYQYNGEGRKVVDLDEYPGEVAVEYLEKISLSGK